MRHLGTVDLEDSEILLRQFCVGDYESVFLNWANDSEVTKYLNWKTHETISDSEKYVRRTVLQYSDLFFYHWAIVAKTEGKFPIGAIFVTEVDDQVDKVHIAYNIGKQWWNKGYTSSSLRLLIRFFFEEVLVNRIEARHDPRNPNSGLVMKKCGLKYEGTLRQWEMNNQGVCDASYYSILADDYFNN